jgi:hypothetical protein
VTAHPDNALIVLIRGVAPVAEEVKVYSETLEQVVLATKSRDEMLLMHKKNKEAKIETGGWFYDSQKREMWVSVPSTSLRGAIVRVSAIKNAL